eukprot:231649_1
MIGGSWTNALYAVLPDVRCNIYEEAGPLTLEKSKSVGTVTPTEYFEIEFEIEFHSLCNNPTGNWGNGCGVFLIGPPNDPVSPSQRYPILFTANKDQGNSENKWYTRLTTGFSTDGGLGQEINFENKSDIISTGIRYNVYVAITPNTYTVNIDGLSKNLIFDVDRTIPSQNYNIYLAHDSIKPANGTLYNICIRSSSSSLYGETTYIFNDPSWYSRTPSIGNQIGTID